MESNVNEHDQNNNDQDIGPTSDNDQQSCSSEDYRFDIISSLPKEVALIIFTFLEPKDLFKAAQTCRYWNVLCENKFLWRKIHRQYSLLDDKEVMEDALTQCMKRNETLDLQTFHFKQLFFRHFAIEHNWLRRRFPSKYKKIKSKPFIMEIKRTVGTEGQYITCLNYQSELNLIIGGSTGNWMKMWCAMTGTCLQTIDEHERCEGVCQVRDDNVLFFLDTSYGIQMLDLFTYQSIRTFSGHTSYVLCMTMNGRTLVTGGFDDTVRIWNIEDGSCQQILRGHRFSVTCVRMHQQTVVSCGKDCIIKVWNMDTGKCLQSINLTYLIKVFLFDGVNIIVQMLSGLVQIWCANTGHLVHELTRVNKYINGSKVSRYIIAAGEYKRGVKIWDSLTGKYMELLDGWERRSSALIDLYFNSVRLIGSDENGLVKQWDSNTGKFICLLTSVPGYMATHLSVSYTKLICVFRSHETPYKYKIRLIDMDPDCKP